jgi:hypothetical protein
MASIGIEPGRKANVRRAGSGSGGRTQTSARPAGGGFISLIHIVKYFLAKMLYGRASRGVNKAFPLPNMVKL